MKDQVAAITGAASGIGRATALAMARAGARLVLLDFSDSVQELVRDIRAEGGEATALVADLRTANTASIMVKTAVETYGRLDVAFNNAGVSGPWLPLAEYEEPDWNEVIAINLTSVWSCMKAEILQMVEQGSGSIINAASLASFSVLPRRAAYVASKHAIVGLTKSAAHDYASSGIRVNAVAPGCVDTPFTEAAIGQQDQEDAAVRERIRQSHPMGRMATAEEIAESVLWLASQKASFVTGHVLRVDGGRTLR